MILVIGTMAVPAEKMNDVRDAMKVMVSATLKEDGCVSYNLCEDLFEEGRIRVSEEWETLASLDAHMETAHMAVWREALGQAGAFGRAVNVYDGSLLRTL